MRLTPGFGLEIRQEVRQKGGKGGDPYLGLEHRLKLTPPYFASTSALGGVPLPSVAPIGARSGPT